MRMIKVLVVDDELLVRITLRTLLDWEKNGYCICGECSDGEQAMNVIPKLHPNIVITDVKMEHVNGDELVRFIDKNYPEICTVVISSYDDYQYVRDTLKHNAVDYLIKNDLTADVLLESLKRAGEKLNLGLDNKKNESDRKAIQKQFVFQLLSGLYHEKEEQLRYKMKLIRLEMGTLQVLPILVSFGRIDEKSIENHMQEKLMIDLSTCTMLEHIIMENHQGLAVSIEDNLILMLISFDGVVSQKMINEEVQRLVQRSDFCLEKYLKQKANFHLGRISSLQEIDQSYLELCEKRKRMFLEEEEYGSRTGAAKEYNNGQGISLQDEQCILLAFKNKEEEKLQSVLNKIFEVIRKEEIPRSGCTQLFNDLIILSFSICKKYGIEYKNIYDKSAGIMEYVSSIERFKDCKAFMLGLYGTILDIIRKRETDKSYSKQVRNAIAYVHNHFQLAISLGETAEALNMNSSYLSKLFKEEVGAGFVEYLNEVRLSHAKELMDHKNMKLKDLIEQSGFYSYQYFFSLFKKKYNMTPKEYMEQLM
jgi:Response regulator containing CheY-like receiver domain and AraC-type DNA-binding domain